MKIIPDLYNLWIKKLTINIVLQTFLGPCEPLHLEIKAVISPNLIAVYSLSCFFFCFFFRILPQDQ